MPSHLSRHIKTQVRVLIRFPQVIWLLRLSFILGSVITGSWDRTVRVWDPRSSNAQQSSTSVPERVYHMDISGTTLVVSMASRLFHIYDVRKMDRELQSRESSLKFMTRSLACMSDGQGSSPCPVSTRFHTLIALVFHRIRDRLSGRPDSSGVLRPLRRCPRKKVRVQMPPARNRGRRSCMARQLSRLPSKVCIFSARVFHLHSSLPFVKIQHLCLRRLRRHSVHLGPQSQEASTSIPQVLPTNLGCCILA